MLWMMGRGRKREDPSRTAGARPPSMELLREEHRRLGAEIECLEGDGAASEPAAPVRRMRSAPFATAVALPGAACPQQPSGSQGQVQRPALPTLGD
jgi:hypothetical protein